MGQIFSLLSAASWGIGNVYALKAMDDKDIDRFTGLCITLFVNNIINIIILAVYCLFAPGIAVNASGLLFFSIGGFLNSFVGRGIFFLSISLIGASRAGIFKIISPLFAIIAGVFILNEVMSRWVWVGTIIVLTGVLFMSLETMGQGKRLEAAKNVSSTLAKSSISKKGIILGLSAGFFLASGNVFRKVGLTYIPDSILGVSVGSFVAFIAALIFLTMSGRMKSFISAVKKMNRSYLIAGIWTSVALYALFLALIYIPISVANSITASEPLFTMLASLVLLGKREVLTMRTLAGAAVVITGIILLVVL